MLSADILPLQVRWLLLDCSTRPSSLTMTSDLLLDLLRIVDRYSYVLGELLIGLHCPVDQQLGYLVKRNFQTPEVN